MPWGWGGGGAVAAAPLIPDERPYGMQRAQLQQQQQPGRGPAYAGGPTYGGPPGYGAAPTGPPPPTWSYDGNSFAVAYYGAVPDYIKLVKSIRIAPFVFTATGAVNPRTRKRFINFSLRETLFGGNFIMHVNRKSLEYRNNLPLPIGAAGSVVLAAEWRVGQPIHKPRLMVALGGDAGAAVVRPGAISWRKAFFPFRSVGTGAKPYVTPLKHLGFETAADVSLAMQHDFNSPGGGNGFKLNFDIKELNLVCRL